MSGVLRSLWALWKKVAHRIGVVNSTILLFLFYFLILGPFALLVRLFRPDLLHTRARRNEVSYWQTLSGEDKSLDDFKYPF